MNQTTVAVAPPLPVLNGMFLKRVLQISSITTLLIFFAAFLVVVRSGSGEQQPEVVKRNQNHECDFVRYRQQVDDALLEEYYVPKFHHPSVGSAISPLSSTAAHNRYKSNAAVTAHARAVARQIPVHIARNRKRSMEPDESVLAKTSHQPLPCLKCRWNALFESMVVYPAQTFVFMFFVIWTTMILLKFGRFI